MLSSLARLLQILLGFWKLFSLDLFEFVIHYEISILFTSRDFSSE